MKLTTEERRRLEAYELARATDLGHRNIATVEKMLKIWGEVPDQLERAEQCVDDYTGAMLLWRDDLEATVEELDTSLRAHVVPELKRIDNVFLAATEQDTKSLLEAYIRVDETHGWWWRRIPRRGSIRAELERRS